MKFEIYFILFCAVLQGGYIDYPPQNFSNSVQSTQSSEDPRCDLFFETCNQVCDESICTSSDPYICSQEIWICETERNQYCGYFTSFNCIPRVSIAVWIELLLFLSGLLMFIFVFPQNTKYSNSHESQNKPYTILKKENMTPLRLDLGFEISFYRHFFSTKHHFFHTKHCK